MLKTRQTVIVEGKYDQARLSSIIDAQIIATGGFDVFKNREKLNLIRALAEKDGIILLTDSDAAGFRIRSYIAGAVDSSNITHVYIPDIFGKERRKEKPSAEGKLGVEGIPAEILLEAFRRAGIAVEVSSEKSESTKQTAPITISDFAEWGLTGADNSAELRRLILQKLGFPARMSTKAMLTAINRLYDREEFLYLLEER